MFEALKSVDWPDVGLHVAGAFGVMTALSIVGVSPMVAIGLNGAAWFGREGWQRYKAERPLSPMEWGLNKHIEWLAPALTGPVMVFQ